MCLCQYVCASDSSHPEATILWGGLVGNYTLLWNHSFWVGWSAHFHGNKPPPPPLLVTHLLHHYMLPKSYIDPVLEKPFHFSFLSETWSNGLLTLHMVSSSIHVQAQYLSALCDLRQWVQLWQAWCPTELHCQNAFSCPALHVPRGVNPLQPWLNSNHDSLGIKIDLTICCLHSFMFCNAYESKWLHVLGKEWMHCFNFALRSDVLECLKAKQIKKEMKKFVLTAL